LLDILYDIQIQNAPLKFPNFIQDVIDSRGIIFLYKSFKN